MPLNLYIHTCIQPVWPTARTAPAAPIPYYANPYSPPPPQHRVPPNVYIHTCIQPVWPTARTALAEPIPYYANSTQIPPTPQRSSRHGPQRAQLQRRQYRLMLTPHSAPQPPNTATDTAQSGRNSSGANTYANPHSSPPGLTRGVILESTLTQRLTWRDVNQWPKRLTRVAAPSPRASLGLRTVCGRTEQLSAASFEASRN